MSHPFSYENATRMPAARFALTLNSQGTLFKVCPESLRTGCAYLVPGACANTKRALLKACLSK
jgi:hypothetical protein